MTSNMYDDMMQSDRDNRWQTDPKLKSNRQPAGRQPTENLPIVVNVNNPAETKLTFDFGGAFRLGLGIGIGLIVSIPIGVFIVTITMLLFGGGFLGALQNF